MAHILKIIAAGAVLAIGIGAGSAYAEPDQTASRQGAPSQSEAQPHGMMGRSGMMNGNMMNGGMGGMMGMMSQANRMMGHCNEMMQSHMQTPNSQWQKPGPHSPG